MQDMTVVLIKPDAVKKRETEAIIDRYVAHGLRVCRRGVHRMTEVQAERFYAEHAGRFYFAGLILAMTSGPVEIILFEGDGAVAKARELTGPTNPADAPAGTIRRDFRSAGGPFNTVHSSESPEAAEREWNEVLGWN